MTRETPKENHLFFLAMIGLLAWVVPGGGHYALGERCRAWIIFVAILLTFLAGLYIGSLGVIDPVHAKPWYVAQVMNSPVVLFVGHHVATVDRLAQRQLQGGSLQPGAEPMQGGETEKQIVPYRVFGRPNEIGQIYTSIAGLLNLLCIVNAIYTAHLQKTAEAEA